MKLRFAVSVLLLATAFAQIDGVRPKSKGYVTTDVVPTVSLSAGHTAQVELRFRVNPGYHVNSHNPGSELLIPTTLDFKPLDRIQKAKIVYPPNEQFAIRTGKITYPAGETFALDFAPKEKISVYTGDVT